MFNDAWIALAVLFGLLGLIFRQGALLTLATLLLTVIPVAWLWNRRALRGVSYERELSEKRAFVGEEVTLTLRVANRKMLPVAWLKAEDTLPKALPLIGDKTSPSHQETAAMLVNLFSLRWHEKVRRRFRISCVERGFYAFGPLHLEASDAFGLFNTQRTDEKEDFLIVYPQVLPLEALGLPQKEPFGETKSDIRLFADPTRAVGLRDYQQGDELKHIHWKASARQQRLQVKVYEPTVSPQWVVFVNVNTLPEPFQGCNPELLERAISVAASIAAHGVEHKHLVGLIANGTLPRSDQPLKVLPSRSPDQLVRILEALAAVTAFATSRIDTLLEAESPKLPWGSTLIVVSGVVSETLLGTLLRLKEAGRKIALISLDEEKVDARQIPGIQVYHVPSGAAPTEEPLSLRVAEVPA